MPFSLWWMIKLSMLLQVLFPFQLFTSSTVGCAVWRAAPIYSLVVEMSGPKIKYIPPLQRTYRLYCLANILSLTQYAINLRFYFGIVSCLCHISYSPNKLALLSYSLINILSAPHHVIKKHLYASAILNNTVVFM